MIYISRDEAMTALDKIGYSMTELIEMTGEQLTEIYNAEFEAGGDESFKVDEYQGE